MSMCPGKKRGVEALWRDFFSNTSQWWDHRPEKVNPRFPDFKHKRTGEALWIVDCRTPPWVQAELAAISPGTIQSNVFAWSQRLKRYVKARQYIKALEVYQQMQEERIGADKWTFLPVLNACAGLGVLEEGKCVHEKIIQGGLESDVYVANCLLDMYAKCGSIGDAWSVFNKMGEKDVVSWNVMITGYVKSGQGLKAMELFRKMQQEAVEPDAATFVGVLNACAIVAALEDGRHAHEQIIQRGWESHINVANSLVDMYAKCGSIIDAWSVFDKIQAHNVISWNAMIRGYVKSGQGLKAIELFHRMQQEGVEPSLVTFVGVLNACARVGALEEGRHVHQQMIRKGYESDDYVATCLVDMYAKCGSIEDAWSEFNRMRKHDVVSWSAMITCYVKHGQGLKAMELFRNMQQEGVEPDTITFVGVLNACASMAALEEGIAVHEQIIRRGFEADVYVATCLVDMYAKCGSIDSAWNVFDKMQEQNVVSWSAMIGGYVKSGQGWKALELFGKMQQEGVEPNTITFVGALNACASVAALEEGKCVHEQIIERGCESDMYVANCLVDMYAKCGSNEDAWNVFIKMRQHDVVSWNAMIVGYVTSGQGLKGVELYRNMQQEGVEPNIITFATVLNACARVGALEEGRDVHEQIIGKGCESNDNVAACLVDMYAKCGSVEEAWSVFSKMPDHDVVSWTAMIGSYVKSGQGLKAIEVFSKMQQEGVYPDRVTFLGLLSACASLATLRDGRQVHQQIILRGWESDFYITNCLIDMYAKCGSIDDAWSVFSKMQERNIVSWNAMIGAYAMHGYAKEAIALFRCMGREGIEIDGITFSCLLSACSQGGLVKEGLRYFRSINSCYSILQTTEHYAGIVDLLGRAGQLKEAEEMTKRMPMERDARVWMSLLGVCRIHGNIEMAEHAAKECLKLGPENSSDHVPLSNIRGAPNE